MITKAISKKILYLLMFLCALESVSAQELSPEVAQMSRNAGEYMDRGNYKDAITTYRQALLLAQENTALYTGLGHALYLNRNYTDAEPVLVKAIAKPDAGEKAYQLLAATRQKLQHTKKAKAAVKEGLVRFPYSGMLYEELGTEYAEEQNMRDALNAWVDGIEKAPLFAGNYKSAAELYFAYGKPLWGILYAEQYLYLAADTVSNDTMKKQLYAGYKALFNKIGVDGLYTGNSNMASTTFEQAVLQVYTQLTPVISDGISVENLTMLRVRFLMEWFAKYNKQFLFPLFTYQDELVRSGYFDMNAEWLFGKAESEAQYGAWNTFHEGDMDRYIKSQVSHRLLPVANTYNTRNMTGITAKRK